MILTYEELCEIEAEKQTEAYKMAEQDFEDDYVNMNTTCREDIRIV